MKVRSVVASIATLCSLPYLTGCIIVTQPAGPAPGPAAAPAPAQPPMEVFEIEASVPVQLAAGLSVGQPPRLQPGAGMAYWVWEAPKNLWHVRSTTSRQLHRFQGRIRPLNGVRIAGTKLTRGEWGDRLRYIGTDLAFDFSTQGGEDGVDFTMGGDGCVEMDLRIDGTSHPKLVVVGKTEQAPASSHFIVCP